MIDERGDALRPLGSPEACEFIQTFPCLHTQLTRRLRGEGPLPKLTQLQACLPQSPAQGCLLGSWGTTGVGGLPLQQTGEAGFQAEGDEVSGSMAKYLSLRKCWGCGHSQAWGRWVWGRQLAPLPWGGARVGGVILKPPPRLLWLGHERAGAPRGKWTREGVPGGGHSPRILGIGQEL